MHMEVEKHNLSTGISQKKNLQQSEKMMHVNANS